MTSVAEAVELVDALREGEVFFEYQPIIALRSGVMSGAEALARWRHPARGVLQPASFVPMAAARGLGDALTAVALRDALSLQSECSPFAPHFTVAVNVIPDCVDASFVDGVARALEASGVGPAHLTLEVTEAPNGLDERAVAECLTALSEMGVRLALDDFGTAQANLARLRQWPFDEVKLDRQFVANAAVNPEDRAIVRFSAGLAHALGMTITAEGVPDEHTMELLAELGVDSAQGFYLARPMPRADLLAGVRTWARPEGAARTDMGAHQG